MKKLLNFSGGKDSTATMYWLVDRGYEFDAVFCDTGAILPEIIDFIYATAEKLKVPLTVIHPPVPVQQWHDQEGLPVDILPIEQTTEYRDMMHGEVKTPVQSYWKCCANMIWYPTLRYAIENNYEVVIRGSRRADTRVGAKDGYEQDGIVFWSPLWDWSTDRVMEFLRDRKVILPRHYQFFLDSLDCWFCTAHLKHNGKERLEFIRQFYPERWPELSAKLHTIGVVLGKEFFRINDALQMGNEDG